MYPDTIAFAVEFADAEIERHKNERRAAFGNPLYVSML